MGSVLLLKFLIFAQCISRSVAAVTHHQVDSTGADSSSLKSGRHVAEETAASEDVPLVLRAEEAGLFGGSFAESRETQLHEAGAEIATKGKAVITLYNYHGNPIQGDPGLSADDRSFVTGHPRFAEELYSSGLTYYKIIDESDTRIFEFTEHHWELKVHIVENKKIERWAKLLELQPRKLGAPQTPPRQQGGVRKTGTTHLPSPPFGQK